MKVLKYLFYQIYQLMVRVGNGDVAEFAAVILMSMMLLLNINTIIAYVYVFTGNKISISNNSKALILSEVIFTTILLYLLLAWKGKYLKILKEYEGESRREKLKGRVYIICYIVFSIGFLLLSFFLMIKKNTGEL